jgi:hypothetical protein
VSLPCDNDTVNGKAKREMMCLIELCPLPGILILISPRSFGGLDQPLWLGNRDLIYGGDEGGWMAAVEQQGVCS